MEAGRPRHWRAGIEVEKLTPVKFASLLSFGKFNGAGMVGRGDAPEFGFRTRRRSDVN